VPEWVGDGEDRFLVERVLVCGSRDWDDSDIIWTTLHGFNRTVDFMEVIEGGARGADRAAKEWAKVHEGPDLSLRTFPADWDRYGKGAGHIRNKQMLDEGKPTLVLAFKDGFDYTHSRGGTENMVALAKAKGVPTYVISHA
jgi:hypothetical protein